MPSLLVHVYMWPPAAVLADACTPSAPVTPSDAGHLSALPPNVGQVAHAFGNLGLWHAMCVAVSLFGAIVQACLHVTLQLLL
jgi:hypothetical protein